MPSFFAKKPCNLKVILRLQGRFFRLSLRQNFSLTKHSRTPPHLRSHSSRRPAPTPQCRSFVIRPCPNATASSSAISAQTGRICIKTSREDTHGKRRRAQGKLCRSQDTAAPGSQTRYDGMRHFSKNAHLSNFKTTAAETANPPARFTLKQYRRVQNAAQTACRRIRLNSDLS